MKKTMLYLSVLFYCLTVSAANKDVQEARNLLLRIAPELEEQVSFGSLKGEKKDVFELSSKDGKIVIKGNSANSMAVGLNHYLKYYCNTSVSWYLQDPVELPDTLPAVSRPVRIESRVDKRFFLNYCTFGYTMPWWKWEDWERVIDWMALNGINMPLAITGQESIWLKVWTRLGLPEEEVKQYFTGPGHLPWHRMCNLDRWHGGLPDSWLDKQETLQKQIVARERALNMTPILPAFAGHVPPAIRKIYPNARISRMSPWGGFKDQYRSYFLDPLDPLFAQIQQLFLTEQKKQYGTDHIYGADPFNEIDSPSWEEDYLATVSKTIYETIRKNDPKAQWLQMTWLFYFDRNHWTNPRIDAFVNAVPKGHMILLDYFAENTEVWKRTQSYFGQPYLWCYLGNFGGNTMLTGNLRETGRRIENVMANGGSNFEGLGSTLEAFDVNPLMYEYVLEKAWNTRLSDEEWIARWADRRTGFENADQRKAWAILSDSVYTETARLGQGTLTNARPSLKGHGNWTTNPRIGYSNRLLFDAWETMLKSRKDTRRDAYAFDVVNLGRQVLGNYFVTLRDELTAAYNEKDLVKAEVYATRMNETLEDMETLLSAHSTFLLGRWLNMAADFGTSDAERAYYKKNARNLLTTWGEKGQSLNDYANRSWAGLTKDYYHARWKAFTREVIDCIRTGHSFDQQAFNKKMFDLEQSFVDSDKVYSDKPTADGIGLAYRMMLKYKPFIAGK